MEISDRSIRCTYDEAKLLKACLTLKRSNNNEDRYETERIENYIEDTMVATHLYASSNLRYILDREPDEDDVVRLLRKLGAAFLAIPRNEHTDEIVPNALSSFTWYFKDRIDELNEAQEEILDLASQMNVEFMINLENRQD
jgi:hypothetical protein